MNKEFLLILKRRMILIGVIIFVFFFILRINKLYLNKNEKTTTYECGYLPFSSRLTPTTRNYLPLRFLFLLFDIELIFLLPYFLNPSNIHYTAHLYVHGFIFLLIISFVIEYKCKIFKKK